LFERVQRWVQFYSSDALAACTTSEFHRRRV
jgi:hypothetical protein